MNEITDEISEEIREDRERIKEMIRDRLERARATKQIRTGEMRLENLIGMLCFNIDNPDYVRVKDREPTTLPTNS